jgi:hypothetical protein
MEDVVGIRVRDKRCGWVGFVTWGRLWDPVDDKKLLEVVGQHLATCAIEEPEGIALCNSLRDIQSAEYFYEALIAIASRPIPFGDKYDTWKKRMRSELQKGRESYFVGVLNGDGLRTQADGFER